ncbi:MAG: hypothetical protein AB1416_08235 [Actinomycetota bacterium]
MGQVLDVRGKRYPVPEPDTYTFREKTQVKVWTGLAWLDYQDGLRRADPECEVAFIRTVLARHNADLGVDDLYDLRDTDWQILDDDGEDAADPPAEPADEAGTEQDTAEDVGDAIRRRAQKKRAQRGPQG